MRRQCSSFKIIRGGTIPIKSRELFFLHNQYIEGNLFLAGRDDDDGSTRSQQLEGNLFLAGRDEGADNTRYQQLEGNLLLARRDDDNDGSTRCQYTRGFPSRRFKVNRPPIASLHILSLFFVWDLFLFSQSDGAICERSRYPRSEIENRRYPRSKIESRRGVQGFSPHPSIEIAKVTQGSTLTATYYPLRQRTF